MTDLSQRVNVLGIGVSPVNMMRAAESVNRTIAKKEKGYVCVTGVHGIIESQRDPELQAIHNRSFMTVPDGMPLVWIGRILGHRNIGRVYGPDLMTEVCQAGVAKQWSHFLYGGQKGVAEQLAKNLQERFPGIRIAGTFTPPFRPLNENEEAALKKQVASARPDCFWVGLSTPKQERFMAEYMDRLDVSVMFGVGAAFDVHTGRMVDAPEWIKAAGLQWLHRLCQEPRRLWKRYLVNNPLFLVKVFAQLFGLKRYGLDGE